MRIALLADSRGFDTYYVNEQYWEYYGYHETFPYLLQRQCMAGEGWEFIHIPDHYRGGTAQNNIIRLALTQPSMVILVNGIWETLLTKDMFLEYVKREIGQHKVHQPDVMTFSFGADALVQLFLDNKLSNSPKRYIDRERQLCSFFRRRGRDVILFGLPVPPREHLDRLHYAGNYRCLPEWGECLDALNLELKQLAREYGCAYFDADRLMTECGGAALCLIDQWHFSKLFHREIANGVRSMIADRAGRLRSSAAQQKYYMPGIPLDEPCLVFGGDEFAARWIEDHPDVAIAGVISDSADGVATMAGVPIVSMTTAATLDVNVVVLPQGAHTRRDDETRLIDFLAPAGKVMLYPDELTKITNPVGRGADG